MSFSSWSAQRRGQKKSQPRDSSMWFRLNDAEKEMLFELAVKHGISWGELIRVWLHQHWHELKVKEARK